MAKSEGGGCGRGARRREHWRGGGEQPREQGHASRERLGQVCRDRGPEGSEATSEYGCLGVTSCGKDAMNTKPRAQTLKDSAVEN